MKILREKIRYSNFPSEKGFHLMLVYDEEEKAYWSYVCCTIRPEEFMSILIRPRLWVSTLSECPTEIGEWISEHGVPIHAEVLNIEKYIPNYKELLP